MEDLNIREDGQDQLTPQPKSSAVKGIDKAFFINAIKYGLFISAAFIIYQLVIYVLDMDNFSIAFSILNFVIFVAIIAGGVIIGSKQYRNKELGGYISFSRSFLSCVVMGLVATLVLGLYSYLFYKFFEPDLPMEVAEKIIERMQDNPNIPEDRLDEIVQRILDSANAESMTLRTLINTGIFSIIISLISALFIRKKETIAETNI